MKEGDVVLATFQQANGKTTNFTICSFPSLKTTRRLARGAIKPWQNHEH